MSLNPTISAASKNAALNAILALLNSGGAGTLNVYTGSQPAGPDTALSGQTLLATLTFSATAFGNASAGVATANAITSGTAGNTGTSAWARWQSGAGTPIVDCTVGASGCDINLSSAAINAGNTVALTSLTVTHP